MNIYLQKVEDETIVMESMSSPTNNGYMQGFFFEIDEITSKLDIIEKDVDRASKMQSKILSDTSTDTSETF